MPESTTPQLTESEVEKIDISVERYLAELVFGEPERGNRYVESLDQDIYFEENADAEFDAFDLLRQFPALIRDWRALKAVVDEFEAHRPGIIEAVQTAEARVDELESENADLREQLAQAERRGRLEGLREADQVSCTAGAIRERIKLLESQL